MTREQLAAKKESLKEQIKALLYVNGAAKEVLTKEENDQANTWLAEVDSVEGQIKDIDTAAANAAAARARLNAIQPTLQPRRAETQDVYTAATQTTATVTNPGSVTIKSEVMTLDEIRTRFAGSNASQKPNVLNKTNGGFRTMGEQLCSIAAATMNDHQGGFSDPRLFYDVITPMASITGAGASVPSDGGYLIQKDLATDIESRMISNGEILANCDIHEISAPADRLTINMIDETSRATGSRWGGVQTYWGAEADNATAQKPKFRQTELVLKDLIGLAYVTERLLMDATALESVYLKAFSEEFLFMMEDGIFNGVGGGQMLGFMKSGAVVKVTRKTSGAVIFDDIVNMYSRLWPRSLPKGVWYINADVFPQLASMSLSIGVAGAPAWLPANQLAGQPYSTLMGRPVVVNEYSATMGTLGDVAFCDLSEYVVIKKGGMRQDSSIHVRFINNERTFRWIYRTDGQPKWTVPITPAKGTNTRSPFVVLN